MSISTFPDLPPESRVRCLSLVISGWGTNGKNSTPAFQLGFLPDSDDLGPSGWLPWLSEKSSLCLAGPLSSQTAVVATVLVLIVTQ